MHAKALTTQRIRRWAACVATGVTLSLCGPAALAAPCAGFTDVDSTDPFCPNVEWLKNRSVTLGCSSGLYCPVAPVSRLSMAAFMNRLGTALTPVHLPVDASPGGINLDAGQVVCQTQDFVVTGFPRRVHVDMSFAGLAAANVGMAADLAVSTDAGATWTNVNATANRGSITATQWGALSDLAFVDLQVGQTARFGVRTGRGGIAGTTQLSDSRCNLRALIYSRTGAASPF